MKLINPRLSMLDGSNTGQALGEVDDMESRMELSDKEGEVILAMLRKAGAEEVGKEVHFKVRRKGSTMHLMMRTHQDNAKKKFLNLSGNPLTFITGSNVYGSPNPVKQLVFCWTKCLKKLEEASGWLINQRIWDKVDERDINLNQLEWACYTNVLKDSHKILNDLHFMFHTTSRRKTDGTHEFLAELLNVVWVNPEYRDSFRLKILNSESKTEMMFGMYDKESEMLQKAEENGGLSAVKASIPDDIKGRLRIDISFHYPWFKARRAKKLKDLEGYVERNYGSDWAAMVKAEMNKVLDRTHLIRMFEIDGEAVLKAYDEGLAFIPGFNSKISTELMFDLLHARVSKQKEREHKRSEFRADDQYKEWIRGELSKIKPLSDANRFRIETGNAVNVKAKKRGSRCVKN